MADGVVVMQRHDDLACWQRPAHDMRELGTHQENMVEMHHIRLELAQQFGEIRHETVEIDLTHEEAIEMAGPKQDFVACRPDGLEARARPCLAM